MPNSYTHSLSYSLVDPEISVNPYPFYKKLQAEAPLFWDEGMQEYLITRYTDVTNLLRDPRFSPIPPVPSDEAKWEARRQILKILSDLLLFTDGYDHTRLRGLMEKAFKAQASRMREIIQHVTDNLLDAVEGSGRMDIMNDLADPLPSVVHSEFLGVPRSDSENIKQWISYFSRFVFGTAYVPTTLEEDQLILQNLQAFATYFPPIIEQRRQEPREDVISELVHVEEQGEKMTQQELVSNCVFLCVGGYASIPVALTNCLLGLIRNPKQMQKLRDEPALIDSAIDELLRHESQVQWVPRRVTEDVEMYGQLIRQNQVVLLGLGAANRDEARFLQADQVDISRTDNRHVAFGYGPHGCLGIPLARPFLQIAINTVLRRLKELRLETDSFEWINAPVFRSVKSLPVKFS